MNNSAYKILKNLLSVIYKNYSAKKISVLSKEIEQIFSKNSKKKHHNNLWDEKDFFLITYADSIVKKNQKNFKKLNYFFNNYCKDFNFLHILPFFPSSSDDGFAIIDYKEIDNNHGDWNDFKEICINFKVMTDLVINHCSSSNYLFKNFLKDNDPGSDYFIYNKKKFNGLSKVVRPRTSILSKEIRTKEKKGYIWCTFSHDQVDFDFKNPKVLIFFLKIIKFYLDNGSLALRLDAVAFLWKQFGTKCINLPETHNIVRLIRLLVEDYSPNSLIITETNIPSDENLSYFGNNNEAHCIYNFSLAPLLIHAIISGNSFYLKKWSRSMPPAQIGNAYLNFLSTHDGIGMRPLEGIIPNEELNNFFKTLQSSGSFLSYRSSNSKENVYEVNTTLLNAFTQTYKGKDKYKLRRFILSHEILFCMEGIPAVYFQNLIGSKNDFKKFKKTKSYRSVNRKNWDFDNLIKKLDTPSSQNFKIYKEILRLISVRKKQPAFHPNATQFTLQLEDHFFGIWRQSIDRSQSIFCISNLTKFKKKFSLHDINLISTNKWVDILNNKKINKIDIEIDLLPYQSLWITNKII
mgnify:CR=1 FL=1